MNWAPTDRTLTPLALAVLHSAIAERDDAFVLGPDAARYCALADVPVARYQDAYARHTGRAARPGHRGAPPTGP